MTFCKGILTIVMISALAAGLPDMSLAEEGGPGRSFVLDELLRLDEHQSYERSFRVSPDSRRVALAARDGDLSYAVVDGDEGDRYEYIGANSISFSPDGGRVAYVAGNSAERFVVVDGARFASYSSIKDEPPVFSPDGSMLAFVAADGGGEFVVERALGETVSGDSHAAPARKDGKRYDTVQDGSLSYSADGKSLVYIAVRDGKKLVVSDGTEGKPYDDIMRPVFGPDGGMAYFAKKDDGWAVVHGGNEGKAYKYIRDGSLTLGPDGAMVYAAFASGKQFLVQDGVEGPPHGEILAVTMSPDGKRTAYAARDGDSWTVCIDGKYGDKYDRVGGYILFSPDGAHAAYIAMRGGEWFVVRDGGELGPYMAVSEKSMVFSTDGTGFAYTAQFGRREWAPVLDGKKLKPAQSVLGGLVFSPDGAHLANIGISGVKQYVAVDGVNTAVYDQIVTWSGGRLVFDSPDSLHYLAVKKRAVFLVEELLE